MNVNPLSNYREDFVTSLALLTKQVDRVLSIFPSVFEEVYNSFDDTERYTLEWKGYSRYNDLNKHTFVSIVEQESFERQLSSNSINDISGAFILKGEGVYVVANDLGNTHYTYMKIPTLLLDSTLNEEELHQLLHQDIFDFLNSKLK